MDGIFVSELTRPVATLIGAFEVPSLILLEALNVPLIGPFADSM